MSKAYKLYVVEAGTGRPVILLHGGFTSHVYWRAVEELLVDQCKLYEPDLLGFGQSPKPRREDYDVPFQAVCLEETFSAYPFARRPILVGHSAGAAIAAHWAAQHPRKFAGVVLSAPVFFGEDTFRQQVASLLLETEDLPTLRQTRLALQFMGRAGVIPARLAAMSKRWPSHIMQDFTSHKYHVFKKIMQSTHFKEKVLSDISKIEAPLQIIIGERDLTSFPAFNELEKACTAHKRCNITTVPTGHQIPLEHPEKIAQAVLSLS